MAPYGCDVNGGSGCGNTSLVDDQNFFGGGSIWFGGTNAFIFRVWGTQLHQHIPEHCNFHIHCCENLKCFMSLRTKYSVIIWELPKKN